MSLGSFLRLVEGEGGSTGYLRSKRVVQGGVSRTVHEQKKQRITDNGYQNFIFPNHENTSKVLVLITFSYGRKSV